MTGEVNIHNLVGQFEGFSTAMADRMAAIERDLKTMLADMRARPEPGIQLTISLRWRSRPRQQGSPQ